MEKILKRDILGQPIRKFDEFGDPLKDEFGDPEYELDYGVKAKDVLNTMNESKGLPDIAERAKVNMLTDSDSKIKLLQENLGDKYDFAKVINPIGEKDLTDIIVWSPKGQETWNTIEPGDVEGIKQHAVELFADTAEALPEAGRYITVGGGALLGGLKGGPAGAAGAAGLTNAGVEALYRKILGQPFDIKEEAKATGVGVLSELAGVQGIKSALRSFPKTWNEFLKRPLIDKIRGKTPLHSDVIQKGLGWKFIGDEPVDVGGFTNVMRDLRNKPLQNLITKEEVVGDVSLPVIKKEGIIQQQVGKKTKSRLEIPSSSQSGRKMTVDSDYGNIPVPSLKTLKSKGLTSNQYIQLEVKKKEDQAKEFIVNKIRTEVGSGKEINFNKFKSLKINDIMDEFVKKTGAEKDSAMYNQVKSLLLDIHKIGKRTETGRSDVVQKMLGPFVPKPVGALSGGILDIGGLGFRRQRLLPTTILETLRDEMDSGEDIKSIDKFSNNIPTYLKNKLQGK